MLFYWTITALLRIYLTLRTQYGYIHPDEFFQTSEIVAGKFKWKNLNKLMNKNSKGSIFNIDIFTTWELNSTFPLRTITVPFAVCGPG